MLIHFTHNQYRFNQTKKAKIKLKRTRPNDYLNQNNVVIE
jgi:hypothetical protein